MKKFLIITGFSLFISGIFIAGTNSSAYQFALPLIGLGACAMVIGIEKK